MIELFRGTLAVDEADYNGNSDLWTEVAKVFNAGYMRNNPVLKCDKENMPESFDVFCPKILSARKRFGDQATESRCLTLLTYQKPRIRSDITLQLPGTFAAEAQEIRNKLLTWRFRNWRRITIDRAVESRLTGLEPRMIQILAPLVAVSADPEFHLELVKYFGNYAAQQRLDSPQALVVEAIRQLLGPTPPSRKTLSVKDVAQKASDIRESEEPQAAREAAKTANGHGEEKLYFTGKHTGHLLRTLGFATTRTKKGYVLAVTPNQLKELSERYPSANSRVGLV
jgi:hypothetical protein